VPVTVTLEIPGMLSNDSLNAFAMILLSLLFKSTVIMSEHIEAGPSNEVEMKEISSTEDDVIIWDEHHCSPRAEVVLVSKDMVGFRVDAWFMKRKR
jgi:hypothetical protein